MSWLLLDIGELIAQSKAQKGESTTAGAVGGSMAGATTTHNIAGYAKPFKKVLKKAPFPFEDDEALEIVYGKKKRK